MSAFWGGVLILVFVVCVVAWYRADQRQYDAAWEEPHTVTVVVNNYGHNYGVQTGIGHTPCRPVAVHKPEPLTREQQLALDAESQHAATLRGDDLLGTHGRFPPAPTWKEQP